MCGNLLPGFTGIDDPYEEPENPEVKEKPSSPLMFLSVCVMITLVFSPTWDARASVHSAYYSLRYKSLYLASSICLLLLTRVRVACGGAVCDRGVQGRRRSPGPREDGCNRSGLSQE